MDDKRRGVMRSSRPIRVQRGFARGRQGVPVRTISATEIEVVRKRTRPGEPRAERLMREQQLVSIDAMRAEHLGPLLWQRVPGLHLSLQGQLPSGKNGIGLRYDPVASVSESAGPRKHPRDRFVSWRTDAEKQILTQLRAWQVPLPIRVPMLMYVWYWPGDRIARDRSGMQDALYHLFERSGLIANDKLIEDPIWRTMPLDRQAPRTEIVLCPMIPFVSEGSWSQLLRAGLACPCCWFPLPSVA